MEIIQGKVLVVDDNATIHDMLYHQLKQQGHMVTVAEDGRQALELVHAQPFDLILLDIMMPEMDGYQVLEHLKGDPTLRHIPVIVISAVDNLDSITKCIQLGAEDYLPKPFNPILLKARTSACLEKKQFRDQEVDYLSRLKKENERSEKLLNIVIPIGVALSAEKDFNRLLEMILLEAKTLCNADGGTLYLRTEEDRLKFVIMRNDSLNIALGGTTGKEISFPPLPMYDEVTGEPNNHNVATYAALSGTSISIADVYQAEGFDFSGTREFDQKTNFRSKSFLTIPLKNNLNQVIGVLQLLNAQDLKTGEIIAFDEYLQRMIESLSSLAAVALEVYIREQSLRQEIEQLRIEIDRVKQSRQVAEIAETDYFQQLQRKARDFRKETKAREGRRRKDTAIYSKGGIYHVNGQPIHVHEEGSSSNKKMVVLIHGWSSSWYAVSPLLPVLRRRFRCLAVDLPGYGESPPTPEPATIDTYTDLLATLIQEVSQQPVSLIGHSMGGMISIALALRYPELVERMVLLCPTISGNLSRFINTFMAPFVVMERFPLTRKMVELLEPQLFSVTDHLLRPALFADRTGITEEEYKRIRADARRPGQGRVRAECFRAMRDNDMRGYLGQIKTPALVIWGMEDNTVPLRDASVVAHEWPDADLRVIPNAGHWPQFETPEITQRYVRAFLSTPLKLLKFGQGLF